MTETHRDTLLALAWSLALALAAYGLWSLAWVVSEVIG